MTFQGSSFLDLYCLLLGYGEKALAGNYALEGPGRPCSVVSRPTSELKAAAAGHPRPCHCVPGARSQVEIHNGLLLLRHYTFQPETYHAAREKYLGAPRDHVNISILRPGSKAQRRGIPETMVSTYGILMFIRGLLGGQY